MQCRARAPLRASAVHKDVLQRRREFLDMDIKPAVRACAVLLIPLLLLSACGTRTSSLSPEEIRRQAEQAELARLRAKERAEVEGREGSQRSTEQREQSSALPPEFGQPAAPAGTSEPLPPPPPLPSATQAAPASAAAVAAVAAVAAAESKAAPPPPGTVGAAPVPATGAFEPLPYDQALPPLPERVLRIAVLGAPSQRSASDRVGVMLSSGGPDGLEKALGVAVRITFLSQTEGRASRLTRVRYRDKYLKAALRVARSIPQAQKVEPMSSAEADRHEVDVLVYVGLDLKP
jgi:hypothetical protein